MARHSPPHYDYRQNGLNRDATYLNLAGQSPMPKAGAPRPCRPRSSGRKSAPHARLRNFEVPNRIRASSPS